MSAKAAEAVRLGDRGSATAEAEAQIADGKATADALYNCACVYSQCFATCNDDSEKKNGYARRTMELLNQAVAAGFNNVVQLREDEDFVALRSRDDFKRLADDLEKKNRSKEKK